MKKINITIAAAAVLCGALALSSCSKKNGGTEESASGTLYLFNWTYYTPDEVLKEFEQKYNCTVKVDTFDSNEVMYAKLKAGATGYDITFPSQDYASIMINQGMLKEIDQNQFANKKYINPAVLEKATYDPTMKYCVPYYMGAAGIAVNKQKLSNYDKSWNIFADPRIKGHASMMDDMREVMGDALKYQGHSVNSLEDGELKSAADLIINSWKPNLVKFDAEGFGKSFASGDFWVCQGYAEVVYGEVPEDKQADMIDFFIPKEGGPMYIDSMVILKDAKHYDLAMKFINFIHEPEVYAQFLDAFRFPSFVNTDAAQYMKTTPMYKAEEMNNCELKMDVGEGLEKYNELWQDIRFTAD
ncbi:MAG TPA: spermidine/putrescine ABC transporter substrate-binding protein [Treponema sp.]|nr:spermidine/putrescine ABC transporter substrate-binding protein [Treponema sp.]